MWIFFKAVKVFYQHLSLEERLSAGSRRDSRAWRVSVGTHPRNTQARACHRQGATQPCSDRLDISFLGTALSSVFLIVSVVEMGIPAHTTPPHSQTPAVSLGCVLGQITLLGKSLCLSSGTKPAPTSRLDT